MPKIKDIKNNKINTIDQPKSSKVTDIAGIKFNQFNYTVPKTKLKQTRTFGQKLFSVIKKPLDIIRIPLGFFLSFLTFPIGLINYIHRKHPKFFDFLERNFKFFKVIKYKFSPMTTEINMSSPTGKDIEKIQETHSTELHGVRINHSFSIFKEKSRGFYCRAKASNKQNSERKVVVLFDGNGSYLPASISCYLPHVAASAELKEFDHYIVEHPKLTLNTNAPKFVHLGVAHIHHLLAQGYKPENIVVAGHSLGGGISANVLKELNGYKLKDGRIIGENAFFGGWIGSKTYAKISDVPLGQVMQKFSSNDPRYYQYKKHNFFTKVASKLMGAYTRFAKWELNTVNAIKKMPVKQIQVYSHMNDKIITGFGSIASEIKKVNKEMQVSIVVKDEYNEEGVADNHAPAYYKGNNTEHFAQTVKRMAVSSEKTNKPRELCI